MMQRLLLVLLLALGMGGASAAELVARAEVFMQAYARDLAAGDRQAVAARYSRRGAIFVGSGRRELLTFDDIKADYATRWRPPAGFRWQELAFEAVGERAVLVTGEFVWEGDRGAKPTTFGYVALLIDEDGELRLRLEDETPQVPPPAH